MTVWKHIETPQAGFLNNLSESVSILEAKEQNVLTDLTGEEMWITSDYSGQHAGASHESYCFLLASPHSISHWDLARVAMRTRWLPDGRRMAFKKLREPVRKRALPAFLDIADLLRGNLICFVVDARVNSLFGEGSRSPHELPSIFRPDTSSTTVEKMLRVAHFLALLVAALRSEDQRAVWISDRDEALEDFDRGERLGALVRALIYGMTRWRQPAALEFGTTALERSGETQLEDLAAIPDLVAGALGDSATRLPGFVGPGTWERTVQRTTVGDERSQAMLDWLSRTSTNLKRLVLRVEMDADQQLRTSAQVFRHR